MGEPSCQRKGSGCPFGVHQPGAALRTARLPAFATLYPNSQTASVCHSLSQQPDCQRLPLFIPTARLPRFATLYPNSQTASVCHSLSQQPDCQRLPLFIPTARLPAFATLYPNSHVAFRHGIHRWLGFLLSRLSPLDPYRIIFTNGLGTFRHRSILRAMVSFVRRVVTLIHMELLPLYIWSCCPYSHLHGCTASG